MRKMIAALWASVCIALLTSAAPVLADEGKTYGTPVDGYRGIWYANQKTNNEYVYKYSGGLGTYCAKHIPHAVYAPEVNKTFFVFGGTNKERNTLLEMVSYYDHETGQVPKPVMLIDKKTTDAHDNPVLSIDSDGHLYVFASAHGTARPAYIFRSLKPYDIAEFEMIADFNYSYPQPWYIEGEGFFFVHTHYKSGRGMYFSTSKDGKTWTDRVKTVHIDEGHYQISWPWKNRVGVSYNYHPKGKGLNHRTNLYYMQSADMGETWTTVDGTPFELPLTTPENPALIHDYEAEGRLVYMKDLNYDADGNPIILHVTAGGWVSGPESGPRRWRVAHWTGDAWAFYTITESDNNYDMGSIFVDEDGLWRVVGPTEVGPQAYNPGGEIATWVSSDRGGTWSKEYQLTASSERNHTYARRPLHTHDGFYAFWADGHGRQPSESLLYFYDRSAGAVKVLPHDMASDMAAPEVVNTVGGSGGVARAHGELELKVARDGSVSIDGGPPADPSALAAALRVHLEDRPRAPVTISAAPTTPFEVVSNAISIARASGVESLQLQTAD